MADETLVITANVKSATDGLVAVERGTAKTEAGVKKLSVAMRENAQAAAGASASQKGLATNAAAAGSTEGLGVMVSSLARLNPALAVMGEATLKQLPTLAKFGDHIKTIGVVGGAAAAVIGSLVSIVTTLTQRQAEYAKEDSLALSLTDATAAVLKIQPPLRGLAAQFEAVRSSAAEANAQIAKTAAMRVRESEFTKASVNSELQVRRMIADEENKKLQNTAEVSRKIQELYKAMEFERDPVKLAEIKVDMDSLIARGKEFSKSFSGVNEENAEAVLKQQRAMEAERLKQIDEIAKAEKEANKQAVEGLREHAEVADTIHNIMSKRQWAQIRLNNLQEAGLLTAEEHAKLQEKINELAAKENVLRRANLESAKGIAEIEKQVAKIIQDANKDPDPMADRLNNAEKIRDAIDEQLQLVRNLVAASKNQNIQEDERKKLVEQAKAEQEKLVTLLAHREKFAKNMVDATARLKQEAADAAKAFDDLFKDRTKQEQGFDPMSLLTDRQKAEAAKRARIQARQQTREAAQALDETTADEINDMQDRGATQKEIDARRRKARKERGRLFNDLKQGRGDIVNQANADQFGDAIKKSIEMDQKRGNLDDKIGELAGLLTDSNLQAGAKMKNLEDKVDRFIELIRNQSRPNFRFAGRLN